MRLRPRWIAAGAGVVFLGMQLVPYGWWHENPPVVRDAPWPDEESEAIARESFSYWDEFSNEADEEATRLATALAAMEDTEDEDDDNRGPG